jgi:hypothetical protein
MLRHDEWSRENQITRVPRVEYILTKYLGAPLLSAQTQQPQIPSYGRPGIWIFTPLLLPPHPSVHERQTLSPG